MTSRADSGRHLPHARPAGALRRRMDRRPDPRTAQFHPGRIIVAGGKVRRGKRKRVDYLLSLKRDLPL